MTTKELLERIDTKLEAINDRLEHIEDSHLVVLESKISDIRTRLYLITGVILTVITGENILL